MGLIEEIIFMKLLLIYIIQFIVMTAKNLSNLLSVSICVSQLFRSRSKDNLVQAHSRSFVRIARNTRMLFWFRKTLLKANKRLFAFNRVRLYFGDVQASPFFKSFHCQIDFSRSTFPIRKSAYQRLGSK